MAINYGKLNAKLTPRGSLKATMGVSGPLNSDYEALINKPQINGNELKGDKSNADLGIPTALEDLTDDSTHRVVTDEQIDAWDNKSDFSGSYDDLTDKPTIPDELADLTDDSTHRLVTDTEKTTWNAKSDFSGSYNDLTDIPANLVQDANYVHTDNNYDNTAKGKVDALGTASTKNVPASGDASTSEVVLGNDTRLTDDRNAKDVYSWAKASTKPEYTATEVGAIASTLKGTANGVAELDANGKVPSAQLPSYVDDVLEYASTSAFPQTGESGKIYIALDTNKTYRWGGSAYVEISESLALGETDSTAYAGNKGKQNADNIATIQGLIPSSATTSNKLATANDIPDISGKADKSEMSVSTSNDLTTIQLKSGTSATVINAHQDISGKANKSEMSVSTNGDKTTIQIKSGTSAEVLNQHQDISGKVDKVEGKGLSTNDYDNTAKGIVDGVTSALADKVDKVNGKGLSTEDYTTAEKTKLGAISDEANKVTSSSTNGHINIDGVDTTVYDDSSVQSDIEDIQDELSTDSATVEGNPLNFTTLTSQNAESTIIDLEPIQDLHGYDYPWVGGAGKNKLNTETVIVSPITFTENSDGSISASPNNSDTRTWSYEKSQYKMTLLAGSYNLIVETLQTTSSVAQGITIYDSNNTELKQDLTALTSLGKHITSFTLNADTNIGIMIKQYNAVFRLAISDNNVLDWTPYKNECPITGRTQVGVLGCGKNLTPLPTLQGLWLSNDGTFDSRNTWVATTKFDAQPNTTYIVSATRETRTVAALFYDDNDSYLGYVADTEYGQISFTFTTPANCTKMAIDIADKVNGQNISPSDVTDLQLELGNRATNYEPYNESNNITYSFGQTVYDGNLDLENGILVLDRAYIEFDGSVDENWGKSGALPAVFYMLNSNISPAIKSSSVLVNNRTKYVDNLDDYVYGCCYSDNNAISFYLGTVSETVEEWKTWLASNNLQVVYELATPTTIQLTPHTINLLKGVNNISTDGDKITLTYRDGSVATLEDVKLAMENLETQIADAQILTDTVTGDKYKLVITNGVLDIQQVSN